MHPAVETTAGWGYRLAVAWAGRRVLHPGRAWLQDPRIAVLAEGERGLRIMVWTLQGDEHRVVAKAIRQVFQSS